MRPVNRFGTPIDPVPFLVVAALGFLVCYSCGPIYLLSYGVGLSGALVLTTVAFVATTAVAYHRFVWTARPHLREEIPPTLRMRRIGLAVLAVCGLLVLLTIPLLR